MAYRFSCLDRKLPANYLIALFLWLISTGLTILDVLYGRTLLMAAFGLTDLNDWALSFIDRAGILLLGLIGLSCTLFFEYFYRRGLEHGQMWSRFLKVSGVQLLIIAAGITVSWVAAG